MNRFFTTLAALILASSLSAQDLAQKIPHDAFAVVNIHTDHFFELMAVRDFDRSAIGRVIIEKSRESGIDNVYSIADFGIALDRSGYFYATISDSITYFNFLLPIADIEKFETLFAANESVVDHGTFKMFSKATADNDSTVFAWDNTMLSITTAELVDGYFAQDAVAERYGIRNYSYADYYEDLADEEGMSSWDDDGVVMVDGETGQALPDTTSWDEIAAAADSAAVAADIYEYNEDEYTYDEYDDDEDYDSTGENLYDKYYAADQEIKRQLTHEWVAAFVAAQFDGSPITSVLTNRSYLSSTSKDALATVWIPSFEAVYTSLLPELREFGQSGKLFSYYGDFQAGLYADGEGFKLQSQLGLNDNMARRFKRIYGNKLNRKFLKYVDTDEAVGLFALSMDTRAYLEELPALMKDTYGGLFERYEDDINLGADLISLLLDEAAIAKVAKGDALFVLNGLTEQEVPYTTYEYDEDYNYIEIDTTRMETIPDFLLMFSSDDEPLYNRIMTYVMNKGFLTEQNGVFRFSDGDLPFELVFARKNGIVFVGTSTDQLTAIVNGSYRGKMDKFTRRLLTKNKAAGLLSAKKIAWEIPDEQLATLDSHIPFRKIFGSMGDFYFKSAGVKRNHISGEFVAQTPEGYENAVLYLFDLVDYALQHP